MIPTKESAAVQILEQIRASHLATIAAVRAWATVAATASTGSNTQLGSSIAPGLPQFEGFPPLYSGWRGDPKDMVDSMYAFAHEVA